MKTWAWGKGTGLHRLRKGRGRGFMGLDQLGQEKIALLQELAQLRLWSWKDGLSVNYGGRQRMT